jgi:hypothetical protein
MTLELSTNQYLVSLPAIDGAAFVDGIETAWVKGNTLAIDIPFPAYPYNSGHWTEVVLPLFRTLADGRWKEHCNGEGAGRAIIGARFDVVDVVVLSLCRRCVVLCSCAAAQTQGSRRPATRSTCTFSIAARVHMYHQHSIAAACIHVCVCRMSQKVSSTAETRHLALQRNYLCVCRICAN